LLDGVLKHGPIFQGQVVDIGGQVRDEIYRFQPVAVGSLPDIA
jgi:hypothetical protein